MNIFWKYKNLKYFNGLEAKESFDEEIQNIDESEIKTEYDIFRLFYTDKILEYIKNKRGIMNKIS